MEEHLMSNLNPAPQGYHTVQPYLQIRGASEAIEFYKKVFEATERMRMATPDGRIGHAEIIIGDSCIMLADEATDRQVYSPPQLGGSPVSIMLYVDDCDATYQRAVEEGAKSLREPADQFYGDRSAGIEDPFGHRWWIGTHIREVSAQDLKAGMAAQKAPK
jgi:PhnB protein